MRKVYHNLEQLDMFAPFVPLKLCSTCIPQIPKPLTAFQKDRSRKDGLRINCKECRIKKYQSNLEYNREKARESWEANRERYIPKHLQWKKENASKCQAQGKRDYKRRKLPKGRDIDYSLILERDGMYCYICEQTILPDHKINFDHVIPVSRNGKNTEDNIKLVHEICNRRKHARLLEEMTSYQRRGIAS